MSNINIKSHTIVKWKQHFLKLFQIEFWKVLCAFVSNSFTLIPLKYNTVNLTALDALQLVTIISTCAHPFHHEATSCCRINLFFSSGREGWSLIYISSERKPLRAEALNSGDQELFYCNFNMCVLCAVSIPSQYEFKLCLNYFAKNRKGPNSICATLTESQSSQKQCSCDCSNMLLYNVYSIRHLKIHITLLR